MIVKRIEAFSLAKVLAIIYLVIGFIVGVFMALIFSMMGAGLDNPGPPMGFGAAFMGVGAVIIMPILYGVIGFISGLLVALVYNVVANLIGGIEIELEEA